MPEFDFILSAKSRFNTTSMKPLNTLLLFVILCMGIHHSYAQPFPHRIKLKEVNQLKNGKLIIGLTKHAHLNKYLIDNVKRHWTFNETIDTLPIAEARKKARADKTIYLITIGKTVIGYSSGSYERNDKVTLYNNSKQIEISKGKKKWVLNQIISNRKYTKLQEHEIAFGIKYLNNKLTCMYENKLKNKKAYIKYSKENLHLLHNKTLLLIKYWFPEKRDKRMMKIIAQYKGKVKWVTRDEYHKTIIEQPKNTATFYFVPLPMGNGYTYVNYVHDAETGQLYDMRPAFFTKTVKNQKEYDYGLIDFLSGLLLGEVTNN